MQMQEVVLDHCLMKRSDKMLDKTQLTRMHIRFRPCIPFFYSIPPKLKLYP